MAQLSFLTCAVLVAAFSRIDATKIGDIAQGEKFTQCIKIEDFHTKTVDDDIVLDNRDASGCCPAGYTAGQQFASSYAGAQIVCGFTTDGTVATSSSSSNGVKTCTNNECYVMKQGVTCTEGKQLLNGCCGTTQNQRTFAAQCDNYDLTFYALGSSPKETVQYCTTWHTDYSSLGYTGTSVATDDQAGGKLQMDKLYMYALCPGSAIGSGSGSTGGSSSSSSGAAARGLVLPLGSLLVLLLLFACRSPLC